MTQSKQFNIQFRNNIDELQRSQAEQSQAKRDGITLSERTSRTGRTMIWCATPAAVVYKTIKRDGTFKYREFRVGQVQL